MLTTMTNNIMKVKKIDQTTVINELNRCGIDYIKSEPYMINEVEYRQFAFFTTDGGEFCKNLTAMIKGNYEGYNNGEKVA